MVALKVIQEVAEFVNADLQVIFVTVLYKMAKKSYNWFYRNRISGAIYMRQIAACSLKYKKSDTQVQ